MTVDLHLSLADPYIRFPLRVDDLLRRNETIEFEGPRLRSPSPEDMLLILCLNGAKDRWERLQRTCDVAAVLDSRRDIDPDMVLRRARELGGLKMLRVSILLAQRLMGIHVSDVLMRDTASHAAARALANDVETGLFTRSERTPGLSLSYARFYVRTRERLRDPIWFYLLS
jgi:Uncharacterised nucleotidyltransferase